MCLRGLVWIVASLLAMRVASADTFSFTGMFLADDQIETFSLDVLVTSTVTIQTLSYAGGTNAASQVIPSGGFDPILSLFDSGGTLLNVTNDGSPNTDPSTGAALDSLLSLSLDPGMYTLALSQSDNQANGPTFADGFSEQGAGSFTSTLGCSNGSFCDITGANRDGKWALDISGVESASDNNGSTVPEPKTILILLLGAAGMLCLRRRRKAEIHRATN